MIRTQVRQRPWLCTGLGCLTASSAVALITCGSLTGMFLAAAVLIYSLWLLNKKVFAPGQTVTAWALEEHERQRLSTLVGTTTEELQELIQYHLSKGNLETADAISQKLIDKTDESSWSTTNDEH